MVRSFGNSASDAVVRPLHCAECFEDFGADKDSAQRQEQRGFLVCIFLKCVGCLICVIGASANVGIPLMLLLIRKGATVTCCHIFTQGCAFFFFFFSVS